MACLSTTPPSCRGSGYWWVKSAPRRSASGSRTPTPSSPSTAPTSPSPRSAPGRRTDLYLEAGASDEHTPSRERFTEALHEARAAVRHRRDRGGQIEAPDGAFGAWLVQSRADVAVLTSDLPTGPYPFAGIPWFCTTFGRDGIITAWQLLWLDPSLAKGVLRFLASTQADETSPFRDSAPCK